MSKMIKVGCCGGCEHCESMMNTKSEPYHWCKELYRVNPEDDYLKSLKFYGIYDTGKILPNCPLDDYPDAINFKSKAKGIIKNEEYKADEFIECPKCTRTSGSQISSIKHLPPVCK